MTAPLPPQPPQAGAPPTPMQPPVQPWTPFTRLPTDTEPDIAKARRIRLARMIDSAKFESFPPEWQQVAVMEYEAMRTIESQAAAAAAQAAQPQKPGQPQPGGPNGQPTA